MIELKLDRYKKVLPVELQCVHIWQPLHGYEWCTICGSLVSGDKIRIPSESLPPGTAYDGKKLTYL